MTTAVHLLDVGLAEYGDALLLQFDDVSVLVDGAHPGDQLGKGGHEALPGQIGRLLEQQAPPYDVDLLIVTHSHLDHIGCLPFLVAHDLVRPRWALAADEKLGWGRAINEAVPDSSGVDAQVRHLVAALREEPLTRPLDDAVVSKLIADAADLETTYTAMLTGLADAGTTVVRYGRDDTQALVSAFDPIGLDVVGPSQDHLIACAEIISGATQDLLEVASAGFATDTTSSMSDAYRRLLSSGVDAAMSRPGAAINLQSIVTTFDHEGVTLLLGGDMQWADPQVSDPTVLDSVNSLRAEIAHRAPFSFAKLSHHGSDNAFSPELLDELKGTPLLGICAGEQSTAHPSPEVLTLLEQHQDTLTWARTDHNFAATFTFDDGIPVVEVERGELNDATPNTGDATIGPPLPIASTPTTVTSTVTRGREAGPMESVEVTARIPYLATRVTISVEVEPASTGDATPALTDPVTQIRLANGRALPPLLFVTNADALARNIGISEAQVALTPIEASGKSLMRDVGASSGSASAAAREVVAELRRSGDRRGVVIVGGHDVVPSLVTDCLPAALRARVRSADDADEFIVWSDDAYGDLDGDGMPELPVSRIPDGKSAELVLKALQADDARRPETRCGVRNVARPFADGVFALLQNPRGLLVSAPATFNMAPPFALDADAVYLMLHGDADDSTRFWGEDPPDYPVAVARGNVPGRAGRVVLAGACWGALTAGQPAARVAPGVAPGQKALESSLALAFLASGSTAFVGCTGSHYSPTEPPYEFSGGPMHSAFWSSVLAGSPPAQALLEAKIQYAKGMPHGQDTATMQAVEYKILREFTCLGLGW